MWHPYYQLGEAASAVAKTGTGGIDQITGKKRYPPVKPTGLLHLPKKAREKRKRVEERVEESRELQAEIAARLAREFAEETAEITAFKPMAEMSMAQIDAEIGLLLRKKLRNDEDEMMLLLLMAASVA